MRPLPSRLGTRNGKHVGRVVAGRCAVGRTQHALDRAARRLRRGSAVSTVGLDVVGYEAAPISHQALVVAQEVASRHWGGQVIERAIDRGGGIERGADRGGAGGGARGGGVPEECRGGLVGGGGGGPLEVARPQESRRVEEDAGVFRRVTGGGVPPLGGAPGGPAVTRGRDHDLVVGE